MCTYFKTETDGTQNLIDNFFSNWLSEDPSIGRILSGKKYGGIGLLSEETGERKQPPVVILQKSIFYNIFMAKNH